jgi:hypothetical protein
MRGPPRLSHHPTKISGNHLAEGARTGRLRHVDPAGGHFDQRSGKRLGFPRWKRLHRLVYLFAIRGAVHFIGRLRFDLGAPPA